MIVIMVVAVISVYIALSNARAAATRMVFTAERLLRF